MWLLALPLYSWLNSIRHEGSHWIVARLFGIPLKEVKVGLFTGVTRIADDVDLTAGANALGYLLTVMAPYLIGLGMFVMTLMVLRVRGIQARWVRLNIIVVGALSPALDCLSNHGGLHSRGDAGILELLGIPVHVFFVSILSLMLMSLVVVCRTWLCRATDFMRTQIARIRRR